MLVNLKPDIHLLRTLDWGRRLFDELIPLPDGTSYNAYVVQGTDKVALIDTTDIRKIDPFLRDLDKLALDKLDYIIANHAEPDHSGAINAVLEKYPDAKVVCTEKCKDILIDLLHVPAESFHVVKDQDKLDLGNYTLQFTVAPWVHWPETMFTYLPEEKVLFTCDFLGNHIASSEVYSANDARVYNAAKRYYAEIMMPFRKIIKKHLDIIEKMDLSLVATSHGVIYDKPGFIIDAYKDWVSDSVKNEVVIPYVSMYGSTAKMVDYLSESLINKGITVKPFMLTATDVGELAMALVDTATIIIGSPTVLTGAHPAAVYGAYLANLIKPKARFASVIGSYGWKGKLVEQLVSMIPQLNVELFDPVVIKGKPKDEDYKKLDQLARSIVQKHEEAGLL